MLSNMMNAQTALDFEQFGQSVQIPGITCPNEFTLEALINSKVQDGGYKTIIEFGNDSPYFGLFGSNLTLYLAATSTTTIPTNQWVHVAATYSSTTMEAKLYINGILETTVTGVTLTITGVGAGIGQNVNDPVFGGSIDNLRIWDVVRTETEILANMNTCLDGSEIGLHAFYNFNEGTGVIVNDLSSNNFNGTLTNMDPATDWVIHDNCNTLSVKDHNSISQIKLFPNPASNTLQVSGLTTTEDYSIYNILGIEVSKGMITTNEKVNIQNLNSGIYFIKINNRNAKKFIKK